MLRGRVRQEELCRAESPAKRCAPFRAKALDCAELTDGDGNDQSGDEDPGGEMPIPRRYEAEDVPRPVGASPQQERDRGDPPFPDHHVLISVMARVYHPGGNLR